MALYLVQAEGAIVGLGQRNAGHLKSAQIYKPLVLVADDDDKIIRFVKLNLKLVGYKVISATNGVMALKLMDAMKPDIMCLDIVMPLMDGFEVLRKVRPKSPLPIIVLSALDSVMEQALSLGANDFLSKPFKPDDLIKKIKTLLGD